MSVWDAYAARIGARGGSKREASKRIAEARLLTRLKDNLSYKDDVLIAGEAQCVAITDTTDQSIKNIYSLPHEHLIHGGLVDWRDSKWLITSLDAHNELYDTGELTRCNYLLKWRDDDGVVQERWCIVQDGTKYLIGEKEKEVMTIGDSRLALTIAKDEGTITFHRGMRFIIDDPDSHERLAYEITKSNRMFNMYDGQGVYRFILREVTLTDDDDTELQVADYYGRGFKEAQIVNPETVRTEGKWL